MTLHLHFLMVCVPCAQPVCHHKKTLVEVEGSMHYNGQPYSAQRTTMAASTRPPELTFRPVDAPYVPAHSACTYVTRMHVHAHHGQYMLTWIGNAVLIVPGITLAYAIRVNTFIIVRE